MRRVVVSTAVSADGVMDVEEWFVPDGEHDEAARERMRGADAILLGRKNYKGLAGYWQSAEGPWADWINPIPKHVASRTLEGPLEWNATLLEPAEYSLGRKAVHRVPQPTTPTRVAGEDSADVAVAGGDIAASTTRNDHLGAEPRIALEQRHPGIRPRFDRGRCRHHPRRAAADDRNYWLAHVLRHARLIMRVTVGCVSLAVVSSSSVARRLQQSNRD